MTKKRKAPNSVEEWHFRECGDHFHAELHVDGGIFPAGTLTKGCCWPTAHALKRTAEGYCAAPTKAELAALRTLTGRMPPTAVGHALGLSAAYFQHRLSGARFPSLQGTWDADGAPFVGSSFPAIGVAVSADATVCPLLVLGTRRGQVDAVPLLNWFVDGHLEVAAGHAAVSLPARAVVGDATKAVIACERNRDDLSASEAHRESLISLLSVLYPHLRPDPDTSPIYIAALLQQHLATATSDKHDSQCREFLRTLTSDDGQRFSMLSTGTYLGIIRELQRWIAPLEQAIRTGEYEKLALSMDLPQFAPRLAMMLEDIEVLQRGILPFAHRPPSPSNIAVAKLLFDSDDADTPSNGMTLGEVLDRATPILHRLFTRTITHRISNPGGAFMQALEDYISRDARDDPSELRH